MEKKFMFVPVFAIGRPGCGKSTASRYMIECMRNQGWKTERIKDYDFLYEMFRSGDPRFRRAAYDGFDVCDFSVLDEVLCSVQDKTLENIASTGNTFVTIEFARDDYAQALKLFDEDLLNQAHFLFVDARLEICIQRIHERVKNPVKPDNHFVSDEIVKGYYSKENLSYMQSQFSKDFRIDPSHMKIITNNDSQEEFIGKVKGFLDEMINVPVLR